MDFAGLAPNHTLGRHLLTVLLRLSFVTHLHVHFGIKSYAQLAYHCTSSLEFSRNSLRGSCWLGTCSYFGGWGVGNGQWSDKWKERSFLLDVCMLTRRPSAAASAPTVQTSTVFFFSHQGSSKNLKKRKQVGSFYCMRRWGGRVC